MNNKIITTIVVLALATGAYWLYSSKEKDESDSTMEETTNEESRLDEIISSFVEKYQAVQLENAAYYTFQLEDIMIKSDRPIVFTSKLDDIFSQDNKLFLRFLPSLSWYDLLENGFGPDIFYTLDGCVEKINEIIERRNSDSGMYIVVAKIKSIKRPVLKVEGSTYDEEVELELSAPQTYLAHGTCLDLDFAE